MAMKIRLARGGTKKRPHYRIVAADGRMPRDGNFIEKLGTYSPLLPKSDERRVVINIERVKYWLSQGAQPTDRIARFLEAKELLDPKTRNNPKKGKPGEKAIARLGEKQEKANAAQEESAKMAAEAAESAAEDAPAEATPAEAPAEAAEDEATKSEG